MRIETTHNSPDVEELLDHAEQCETECDKCHLFVRDTQLRLHLIRTARAEAEAVKAAMRYFPLTCVYCGTFAEHQDHLLPEPWTGAALRKRVPTVPACANCNETINDFLEPNVSRRAAIIASRLANKHRIKLKGESKCNLEGLEGNLKSRVEARRYKNLLLRSRLLVLQQGGFMKLEPWEKTAIQTDGVESLLIETR